MVIGYLISSSNEDLLYEINESHKLKQSQHSANKSPMHAAHSGQHSQTGKSQAQVNAQAPETTAQLALHWAKITVA